MAVYGSSAEMQLRNNKGCRGVQEVSAQNWVTVHQGFVARFRKSPKVSSLAKAPLKFVLGADFRQNSEAFNNSHGP
ncbi:hypothetical protein LshimejAT787_0211220 [Lyophyllum shimeji]|uniref:Uncharacterized protein n=1 Tax=Lyophyllum shimeji TaxID=47721 RepID=A0A9P3PGD6_LYOSH|nr:hypothetical protein LshimejAT787_0211220 [Lyophyllum shimeji]